MRYHLQNAIKGFFVNKLTNILMIEIGRQYVSQCSLLAKRLKNIGHLQTFLPEHNTGLGNFLKLKF